MFPIYRVLLNRMTQEPTVMLCSDTDASAQPRLYVRLETLPPAGQVLVVRALWAKHGFDVREAMQQPHASIYLDPSGLGALTDGALTAVERVARAEHRN
jgi:hypothetical protein